DSLNAIQHRFRPYVCNASAPGASPSAAVATAAHAVLVTVFPAQATKFDEAYAGAMEEEHDSVRMHAGIALGRQCAEAILANRANDGAAGAQVPYTPGPNPGDYQFTPPFDLTQFATDPLWGSVKPFVLDGASQFRSPAPYALA